MKKSVIAFALCTLAFSVYCVFQIKYRVKELVRDVVELNRQITSDKEAIHVLNAEWTYLNRPERLKALADRYLGMTHIEVSQIKTSPKSLQSDHGKNNQDKNYSMVIPNLKPILSSAKRYE